MFDKIRASIRAKAPMQEAKKLVDSAQETSLPNISPKKVALKSMSHVATYFWCCLGCAYPLVLRRSYNYSVN